MKNILKVVQDSVSENCQESEAYSRDNMLETQIVAQDYITKLFNGIKNKQEDG